MGQDLFNDKKLEEKRKLFPNKGANIALIVLAAIIVIGIAGLAIWTKM